jgi:hypothetical protein
MPGSGEGEERDTGVELLGPSRDPALAFAEQLITLEATLGGVRDALGQQQLAGRGLRVLGVVADLEDPDALFPLGAHLHRDGATVDPHELNPKSLLRRSPLGKTAEEDLPHGLERDRGAPLALP